MAVQRPNFKPNPCTAEIPREYLDTMTIVPHNDGDALINPYDENYLIMTAEDDEKTYHLVYRDDQSVVSLLRSPEKQPIFMLRDRCRLHSESAPYLDYGFWFLCHPVLSPKILDDNSRNLRTASRLQEIDFSMELYEKCLTKYAENENGGQREDATESFTTLWGTFANAVKTACETDCINSQDLFGNTPLHLAVAKQDIKIVKFLILMGADPHIVNHEGHSAFHVAAQMISLFPLLTPDYNKEKVNEEIVLSLMYAEAKCCEWDSVACSNVCMSNQKRMILCPDEPNLMEELLFPDDNTEVDHNKNSIQFIEEVIKGASHVSERPNVVSALSLDGGGVKGLVMLQILIAIEERLEGNLIDYFDWVAGTSTGAIVAGALGRGMSLRTIQKMYFQFKDVVFQRKILYIPFLQPAYSATVLENFLKKELGEETTLADIKYPKMFFTTVRSPKTLVLQRTYWKTSGKIRIDEDPKGFTVVESSSKKHCCPNIFPGLQRI